MGMRMGVKVKARVKTWGQAGGGSAPARQTDIENSAGVITAGGGCGQGSDCVHSLQKGTVVVWGGNIEAVVFDLYIWIDECQSLLGRIGLGHAGLQSDPKWWGGMHKCTHARAACAVVLSKQHLKSTWSGVKNRRFILAISTLS